MIWSKIRKISEFLSENFHFLVVKCSIYLNKRVFVIPGNSTITKHSLPESPKEGEMRYNDKTNTMFEITGAQTKKSCKTLRKHVYSDILKISSPKKRKFSDKKLWYFSHVCWGGSNGYPQSMFLSRNKKNDVYPCKPQFYYIKWGLTVLKLHRYVFIMRDSALERQ